jgi:hypothetical protein
VLICGFRFRVSCLATLVRGFWSRVQALGFRVSGFGVITLGRAGRQCDDPEPLRRSDKSISLTCCMQADPQGPKTDI